jgi:glycyl-tRNA synthetase beta chain
VYHNKLGTQGERMARVRAIARVIGQQLGGETLAQAADTAARLAKTDLLTDMVGEFPELQGIMGGYYARHDGLSEDIAFAIEDHYKPRFAGDELPRNAVGVAVALADKLETLVGMFGIGNLPSGDKDPFALRRHALGVIRMLTEKDLPLDLGALVAGRSACLRRQDCRCLPGADRLHLRSSGRLAARSGLQRAGSRRGAGAAPSAPGTGRPAAGGGAGLCRAAGKSGAGRGQQAHRQHPEEGRRRRRPCQPETAAGARRTAAVCRHAAFRARGQCPVRKSGDYTTSLQTLAVLHSAVDAFFDDVMVNAEEMDLRLNRQGLLKCLHDAMNRVADLSRLA